MTVNRILNIREIDYQHDKITVIEIHSFEKVSRFKYLETIYTRNNDIKVD